MSLGLVALCRLSGRQGVNWFSGYVKTLKAKPSSSSFTFNFRGKDKKGIEKRVNVVKAHPNPSVCS
jgi:hypothetical protein